jgi:hypothetical protein
VATTGPLSTSGAADTTELFPAVGGRMSIAEQRHRGHQPEGGKKPPVSLS